ncbi:hypothetical protein P3X46_014674 [Hevea brasiliensis]|uniref:BZIP domain-containing protein n=1 Tax=Hevea brasiliensis TaxID=3981 RepID=A0ABQ9LUU1_HEVBR|nr:protein LITTLE ZIPPER 4 isoform X2 [Hevea brasiliensis]KAJ9171285.1 hypothetical protein P3X46_014674 [Hevea brasiliensis]
MYTNSSKLSPCSHLYIAFNNRKSSRGSNLPYRRLISRRRRSLKQAKEKKMAFVKKKMEIKNLKLYMKNKSIIEENEKLRKKALLLHQENQALLFQLQKRFSESHDHLLAALNNNHVL